MIDFIIYDVKVAVLIAVFYMFYRLLLSRETFHRVNRIVLISTAALSFVLPLLVITFHHTMIIPAVTETTETPVLTNIQTVASTVPLWQTIIICAFFLGMALTLSHTILSLLKVKVLIANSEKHVQDDGTVIAVTSKDIAPFSFMRYIVLSRTDYIEHNEAILAHERGHISHHHSLDVLFVDIVSAVQWFNPAIWMLRSDLRTVHEYEADEAVIQHNFDARNYQYLLIRKAVGSGGYSIANSFNNSTLNNRINMMLRKKSDGHGLLKLLFAVPIIALALAANAKSVTDYKYATSNTATTSPSAYQQTVKKSNAKGNAVIKVKDSANAKKTNAVKIMSDLSYGGDSGLDKALILIDSKESTKEELNKLYNKAIHSITVLKDKSATDIYGKRGANGVIIVVTNKFNEGQKAATSDNGNNEKPKSESLDNMEIKINLEKATKADVDKLYPEAIESITVDKSKGKQQMLINTKKNYTLNGKSITKEEADKINPSDIKEIRIEKKSVIPTINIILKDK
jgi:TonB-dependent SusC/RagA subfamily outer membrane receptor